jgi:hypothetical protein
MSNYKDVMRKYQQIVLELIVGLRELSDAVDSLSSAVQRNVERELVVQVKEKPNG